MRGTKFNSFYPSQLLYLTEFRYGVIIILAILSSVVVNGQELSNFKEKKILLTNDTTRIDTFSIAPLTFNITQGSTKVDSSLYELDPASSILIWKGDLPTDSLTLRYRTFPIDFSKSFSKRSTDLIQPEDEYIISPYTYRPESTSDPIFGSTKLNKTGSISRGVGFGNNQDLTVNSSLSLQLNGKLTDKINVLASVTDDNIPIQPEGNTAQLQE